MKLSQAKPGDVVRVLGFEGFCDGFRCRLEAMGLHIGDVITIEEKAIFGPLTVVVGGVKLAIGRKQADRIQIKKL